MPKPRSGIAASLPPRRRIGMRLQLSDAPCGAINRPLEAYKELGALVQANPTHGQGAQPHGESAATGNGDQVDEAAC